jgi:hypothetical protein
VVDTAAAVAAVGAVDAAGADVAKADLAPMATAIGEAWARELVRSLRSDQRDIEGEWPGTMGEARMRIRVAFRRRIDIELLDELARVANLAARRGWIELRNDPRIGAAGASGKLVPVRG